MDLVSVLVSVADSRASEPLPHMRSGLEAMVGIGLCFPVKNAQKMPCFLEQSKAI